MTQDFAHKMVTKSVAAQKKILAALEARPELGEVDVYSTTDTYTLMKDGVLQKIEGYALVIFEMNIPLKNSAAGEVRPVKIKFGQYQITVKADNEFYDFRISDPASPQQAIDLIIAQAEKVKLNPPQPKPALSPSSQKKTLWRAAADNIVNSTVGFIRKRNTPKIPRQTKRWWPFFKPRQ